MVGEVRVKAGRPAETVLVAGSVRDDDDLDQDGSGGGGLGEGGEKL